jgi:hypothetical protein
MNNTTHTNVNKIICMCVSIVNNLTRANVDKSHIICEQIRM